MQEASRRLQLEGFVQWDGSASEVTVAVVAVDGVTVGWDGVCRIAGSLRRLDGDVAVTVNTGTGWDELTDDDVLLQTDQRVRALVDGGVGKNAGGLLERGGRQPRLGSQGSLGDTHDLGTHLGRLATFGDLCRVDLLGL